MIKHLNSVRKFILSLWEVSFVDFRTALVPQLPDDLFFLINTSLGLYSEAYFLNNIYYDVVCWCLHEVWKQEFFFNG